MVLLEQAKEIPLLDILVKRCPKNTFTTSVYRKKTFTGLYTKWDLFTPRKYKINLIRTLTYRCFRICSTASWLKSAVEDLKRLLLQNGYPQGIITFNINDVLNKNRNKPNDPVATVPQNDVIILLPYLGLHSNHVTKRLKSCVIVSTLLLMSRLFFKTHGASNPSSHTRTVSTARNYPVIYEASCWDCNDFYIGKTKRRLHDRKTEHFKALLKNDQSFAIADHVKNTGHNIKWDHFDIWQD